MSKNQFVVYPLKMENLLRVPTNGKIRKMNRDQLSLFWSYANSVLYYLRSGTRRRSQVFLRQRWREARDEATRVWHLNGVK